MHEQTSRSAEGGVFRRWFLRAVGAGTAIAAVGSTGAAGQQDGYESNDDGGDEAGDDGESDENDDPPAGDSLITNLSGDEEVPPVETDGDGFARFSPMDDDELRYRLEIADLTGVTQAHVHEGVAGTNGPVVADLLIATENADGTGAGEPIDATGDSFAVVRGTIDDADLVERMRERPSRYYVNVHTVDNPAGEIRGQLRHETAEAFTVRIENVSDSDALRPSDGSEQPVPLSPGAFAVHSTIAPLFTPGLPDRGEGLEAIAEDGDPTELSESLAEGAGIADSGVFATPVGADEAAPIGPGDAYEFSVRARPGQHLSLATMFVPSNDLFFAPDACGIALFDDAGHPVDDDVTDELGLWDAGTEENEEPGVGEHQVQRQSAPDTGPDEGGTVLPVAAVDDGYDYPDVEDVIRLTVSPS